MNRPVVAGAVLLMVLSAVSPAWSAAPLPFIPTVTVDIHDGSVDANLTANETKSVTLNGTVIVANNTLEATVDLSPSAGNWSATVVPTVMTFSIGGGRQNFTLTVNIPSVGENTTRRAYVNGTLNMVGLTSPQRGSDNALIQITYTGGTGGGGGGGKNDGKKPVVTSGPDLARYVTAGVGVAIIVLAAAIGFVLYRRRKRSG